MKVPQVWKDGLENDQKENNKATKNNKSSRGGWEQRGGRSKAGRDDDDNTSVEMTNDDEEDDDDEDDDEDDDVDDDDEDDDSEGNDSDDLDDDDEANDDDFDDIIPCVDDTDDHTDSNFYSITNSNATGKIMYDPCYWIPSLHQLITQPIDLPVRQLANTGVLSLILATLSTKCVILRTLALSSLQRIFELVKRQGPDKDAAFRERPQILVLLNFVKNSVEGVVTTSTTPTRGEGKKGNGVEPMLPLRLPSVVSLFLARAALHLLQPGHELFSKINKYLLSRPYCDVKDVPLFDLLIADGDVQTDMAPRLATFRIVRDGLTTRTDHLNLCRKNGYNRLMLLFPVLTKQDTKAGHAVLDLLEKAMGMPSAARYLIERCGMVRVLFLLM